MPITDKDTQVFDYPMSKLGVNLHKNPVELHPEECFHSKNLIYHNGMVKRGGSSMFSTTQVVSSKKILGLHRFYYSGTTQMLAACDTTVKHGSGTTWTNVKTGLTTGMQTYFTTWGPMDKCYIGNGTNVPHSWDGSSSANLTAAPANTLKFLPYQDRLLSITGGDLSWSKSFDDTQWESVTNTGVRPDIKLYGMIHHGVLGSDQGYEAKVLLAGATGMYLFAGSSLSVSVGDYVVYDLNTVGCNAPRTMRWTPKGSIWLGVDKQVYLLPFGSATPVSIGDKIHSNTYLSGIEGIEDVTAANISKACAAYHEGFYILSIGTNNDTQWWLDVSRLQQDEDGFWGPWYGPMKNHSIGCFVEATGDGDAGELYGGEAVDATGGYVYGMNESSTHNDSPGNVATPMNMIWRTHYNPLGTAYMSSEVHMMEFELMDSTGTVSINYYDIGGTLKTADNFTMGGNAVTWGDFTWGDFYWSGGGNPTRKKVDITPAIKARRLSYGIEFTNDSEKFELYAMRVPAKEGTLVFD